MHRGSPQDYQSLVGSFSSSVCWSLLSNVWLTFFFAISFFLLVKNDDICCTNVAILLCRKWCISAIITQIFVFNSTTCVVVLRKQGEVSNERQLWIRDRIKVQQKIYLQKLHGLKRMTPIRTNWSSEAFWTANGELLNIKWHCAFFIKENTIQNDEVGH